MAQMLTQYSSHANTIADTVRAAFVQSKVGDCTVEMTAPQGSTQGGKLALQHVTLRPAGTGTGLVVGTLNAGEKRAAIRSYVEVARVHETRFKKPAGFDRAAYDLFVTHLGDVLGAFGIESTVTTEPQSLTPGSSGPASATSATSASKSAGSLALPSVHDAAVLAPAIPYAKLMIFTMVGAILFVGFVISGGERSRGRVQRPRQVVAFGQGRRSKRRSSASRPVRLQGVG